MTNKEKSLLLLEAMETGTPTIVTNRGDLDNVLGVSPRYFFHEGCHLHKVLLSSAVYACVEGTAEDRVLWDERDNPSEELPEGFDLRYGYVYYKDRRLYYTSCKTIHGTLAIACGQWYKHEQHMGRIQ